MYSIYLDGQMIYTPGSEDLAITEPSLSLELNSPGTLTFTMPNKHPYFDSVRKMLSRVEVYRDDDMIFCGRVTGENIDFWKNKTLTCEGELAFLNDSIQRPAEYHNMTVREYLNALISSHNSQVESDKQFTVGVVTVTDSNDSLYRYTNYNSTMEEIKEDLVDDLGGYLRVRHYNGVRYLDYVTLTDYGNTLDQAIRFGVNLLDFTEDMDVTDLATVVIPLGERLEESPIEALDMRLTIEEVNDGKDYVQSDEGVNTYGRLVKVITWDDVTQASTLKSKAETYLKETQWDNVQITATAVDMHLTGEYDVPFGLGDYARVVSDPHGLDRYFPISALTLYLDNPENDTYTMGLSTSASLIGQLLTQTDLSQQLGSLAASTSTNISNVASDVLNEAQNIATILINAATHGYVVVEPDEILIMDTNDKETAKRVWRWNLNGLGYSSTGYYGTFGTAMTMDGGIVADYITTGTMYADRIKGGTLTLGGSNNTYGQMTILDASGSEVGSWNRNGITAEKGYVGNWIIGTNKIYNDLSAYGKTAVMQMPTSSNTWVFAAGGESHSSYSDCPFRVDKDGNMYATSADIEGTITATKGTIGGWTIGTNSIKGGSESYGSTAMVQIPRESSSQSRYWVFAAGGYDHDNHNDCRFRVGSLGEVYIESDAKASSHSLIELYEGEITASSEHTSVNGYYTESDIRGGVLDLYSEGRSVTTSRIGAFRIMPNLLTGYVANSGNSYWFGVSNLNQRVSITGDLVVNGSTITGSDMALKTNMQPLSGYSAVFDALEPITFNYKAGGGTHMGFTYQNAVEALKTAGIDPDESALVEEIEDNGETYGGIDYNNIIAMLVSEVQTLKARVDMLERR